MRSDEQGAEALIRTVFEGGYRIEGLLGAGGMGAVYVATHLRLAKRVAVKVMTRELASSTDALARFHREAVVTGGLGHPHIVQVFDFSTTPTGEPFLVMELLEGEDLEHRLRRVGRLPAARVVHIVKQVASALAATHAKTIVHRDLKPANVYLLEVAGESDFVKVLDFGISKVRGATTKLTQAASVMGTPNYMSPEQALGKVDEIDERTDQWALACIAWECLSGAGPFVGENVPSVLFQVVHESPEALLPKVPGLRAQVEKVLRRALAKNKNDRFASVNDFALALEASMAGSPVSATAQLPSVSPFKTTTFTQVAGEVFGDDDLDAPRARPKWPWALGAGAAAVLLLGAFMLLRPSPPVVARPTAAGGGATFDVKPPAELRDEAQPAVPRAEPSAGTPLPDSVSADKQAVDRRYPMKKQDKKMRVKELEDQWRVE
jgi:serine/threonine protein kinase